MSEYTPTTEEVRAVWCAFSEYGGLADRPHSGLWEDRLAEFTRWLAARDRENRAIGWSEALEHVWQLNDPACTFITDTDSIHPILTRTDVDQALNENPYRGDNR